ncbi:Uncharacterised protein [Zhongshania aliphaticivorans]|uniref:Uncharacterized protein n=1 Tax=Zhongshania aliphaticivorans TaxID=1470434 RepID=A0A5S9NGR8_9GAMM|nr:hypothetical protein [Zhongshania aliphaticivorans]CAA0088890.1 Uncharacterised protein [Zhongshania aliphaticivorans]CAA0095346.1 Uncharacterised protein [Zhongshania aliphaticivorans]
MSHYSVGINTYYVSAADSRRTGNLAGRASAVIYIFVMNLQVDINIEFIQACFELDNMLFRIL